MAAEAHSRNRIEIAAGRPKRRRGALRRLLTRLMRDQRAVAAVELGLSAAFILPVLMPFVDLGMAFSEKIKLQQAVQAGAQYASMNVWNSSNSPTAITNVVTNALPTSLQSVVSVTPASETCGCPTGTTSPYLNSVDSLSTCGTTTCSDGEQSGYYVTVAATLSYNPLMPLTVTLNLMSSPESLSATSVVRVQ